jgi:hypothetical protein
MQMTKSIVQNNTLASSQETYDDSDLYDDSDNSRELAHRLKITISTDDPRLRRALERQAQYENKTVEQYVAESIAHIVTSDEGQSRMNHDGTIDR